MLPSIKRKYRESIRSFSCILHKINLFLSVDSLLTSSSRKEIVPVTGGAITSRVLSRGVQSTAVQRSMAVEEALESFRNRYKVSPFWKRRLKVGRGRKKNRNEKRF